MPPGQDTSMNNLNDPPRWNMGPDPRGGAADGNQWNYAPLVPMLALAAFRWIWTRESQREIIKVKAQYDQDMSAVTSNLEMKYRDTLTENRRAAAILELELEEERQTVQGYRRALISQSQRVMEERKQLQALEQEKTKLLESGAAGAILQRALDRESDWHQRASAMLKDLEEGLVERQGAYCNLLLPREHRLEMEKNLLLKVVKEPLGTDTDLEGDLKDIFKNDRYCAKGNNRLLNVKKMDKRKNGSLMWLYLRYWQLQVTMETHKRAEDSILGNNHLK
ncbi:unnamed protein product [Coregonus sp. 'balchen']|nr:unnamed protein product [Coregonus sp. 'balchen']